MFFLTRPFSVGLCGQLWLWTPLSGQTELRAWTLGRLLSPPALGASEGQSVLLWKSLSHQTRGVMREPSLLSEGRGPGGSDRVVGSET